MLIDLVWYFSGGAGGQKCLIVQQEYPGPWCLLITKTNGESLFYQFYFKMPNGGHHPFYSCGCPFTFFLVCRPLFFIEKKDNYNYASSLDHDFACTTTDFAQLRYHLLEVSNAILFCWGALRLEAQVKLTLVLLCGQQNFSGMYHRPICITLSHLARLCNHCSSSVITVLWYCYSHFRTTMV